MSRIIIHEEKGPVEINGKWVCRCGLSKNKPYCDGSHKKTLDEEQDIIYKYNPDETREVVQ